MTITPIMKPESQDTVIPHITLGCNVGELPPPYCEDDSELDIDSDADEDSTPDVRLSINAEQVVQGSHNLVPINSMHVAHATKLSAMILSLLSQADKIDATTDSVLRPCRKLNIHLNMNCGVTVVGDRNIVGNFGITPKMAHKPASLVATAATTNNAITNAKRRSDDDVDNVPVKRAARPNQTPTP